MSAQCGYRLFCDGTLRCDATRIGEPDQGLWDLREDARQRGWAIEAIPGRTIRDFCPACATTLYQNTQART